jgi:hypothetical protein
MDSGVNREMRTSSINIQRAFSSIPKTVPQATGLFLGKSSWCAGISRETHAQHSFKDHSTCMCAAFDRCNLYIEETGRGTTHSRNLKGRQCSAKGRICTFQECHALHSMSPDDQ